MAKTKAASSTGSGRDSRSKRLGVKIFEGQKVKPGNIIIRQRGTKFLSGNNVGCGKDYTIFALKAGVVRFRTKRKRGFDNSQRIVKIVDVESS
jgi:large subunit ribosomal protein L27